MGEWETASVQEGNGSENRPSLVRLSLGLKSTFEFCLFVNADGCSPNSNHTSVIHFFSLIANT